MAIKQGQSKILRICLFAALLVASADAASLRGSNEGEVAGAIIDDPLEAKNEGEEPGLYEALDVLSAHDFPEDQADDRQRELQQGRRRWNSWSWGGWWSRPWRQQQTVVRPLPVVERPVVGRPVVGRPVVRPPTYFAGGGGGTGIGNGDNSVASFLPANQRYPVYAQPNNGAFFNNFNGAPAQFYSGPNQFYPANIRQPAVAGRPLVPDYRPVAYANPGGVDAATGNFMKTPGYLNDDQGPGDDFIPRYVQSF